MGVATYGSAPLSTVAERERLAPNCMGKAPEDLRPANRPRIEGERMLCFGLRLLFLVGLGLLRGLPCLDNLVRQILGKELQGFLLFREDTVKFRPRHGCRLC